MNTVPNEHPPRVFLIPYGETRATRDGRYSASGNGLTVVGLDRVTEIRDRVIGPGKPIDPDRIQRIYICRHPAAVQTFQVLFPPAVLAKLSDEHEEPLDGIKILKGLRDWDYGHYEDMTDAEIREMRRQQGLDPEGKAWSIWKNGFPGPTGERPSMVEHRIDHLMQRIRDTHMIFGGDASLDLDVVLIAHHLILTAFAKRWMGHRISDRLTNIASPGAILSYEDGKPTIQFGMIPP